MFTVRIFHNARGKEPFKEWINALSPKTKDRIFDRINRIEKGNLGDYKHIGSGVYELRFFFDGGLRIYFGRDGDQIILLLCGGDKSSQKRDIEKALEYWREYHEHKRED